MVEIVAWGGEAYIRFDAGGLEIAECLGWNVLSDGDDLFLYGPLGEVPREGVFPEEATRALRLFVGARSNPFVVDDIAGVVSVSAITREGVVALTQAKEMLHSSDQALSAGAAQTLTTLARSFLLMETAREDGV